MKSQYGSVLQGPSQLRLRQIEAHSRNFFAISASVAVLRPNQGEHGTIFVLGRDNPESASPTVILASEHYNMIVRMIEAGEPVSLRIAIEGQFHEDDTNGYNILAEIPGVDPQIGNEVVMVGAHLDSWHSATGASDNADAVASVMEAMRILKELGVQPRRTIRVALWGSEEQGLHGSRGVRGEAPG